jgi:hypothetical protein
MPRWLGGDTYGAGSSAAAAGDGDSGFDRALGFMAGGASGVAILQDFFQLNTGIPTDAPPLSGQVELRQGQLAVKVDG